MERCKEVQRHPFIVGIFNSIEDGGRKGKVYLRIWNPVYERLGRCFIIRVRALVRRRALLDEAQANSR